MFPEIFLNVISLNFPLFLGGWGTFFALKNIGKRFPKFSEWEKKFGGWEEKFPLSIIEAQILKLLITK
jgi:hypothetical protein